MSTHAEGVEQLIRERDEARSALAAAEEALKQAAEARDEAQKLAQYYRSLLLRQGDPVARLVRHDPWDYPWVRGPWDEDVDEAHEYLPAA
jgi:nucleoid-associated protein YgaU